MGLTDIIYKKSFLVIVGVFLIIAISAFAGLSRISEKPSYCVTCHFMTPFYERWQTSSHNKVECLKCHEYGSWNAMANQFKFFAGSSNPRPRAEVPDAKCLQTGCHSMRLAESQVTFKQGILFDHKPHFTEIRGGMKLHCASCHYDMVQGNHLAVSEDTCFLCHFRKKGNVEFAVTGCPSCHGAPTKAIMVNGKSFEHRKYLEKGMKCEKCHLQVIEGDGNVPSDRCFFCHVDRGSRYNDVEFVHNNHVTKKNIDCHRCHTRIKHGKIKMAYNLL
ncbi:MAG: NapC/NirT family cytochrome c [Nitrospirota bacterium]|nr:NapC/NirT family cytochrome c [Nitrospirota bacterium]